MGVFFAWAGGGGGDIGVRIGLERGIEVGEL